MFIFGECMKVIQSLRERGDLWLDCQRFLSPPLGYLGRQGSSGKGSWEKTESSPEEHVELLVSGKHGEYWLTGMARSRYSYGKEKVGSYSCIYYTVWLHIIVHDSATPCKITFTWLELRANIRSRSSTSCTKVGLWHGTACQQSLIIMYLEKHYSIKATKSTNLEVQYWFVSNMPV